MSDIKQIIYSSAVIGENCPRNDYGGFEFTDCEDGRCDCDNLAYETVYQVLDEVDLPGHMICIADIGRWNGRVSGYAMASTRLSGILFYLGEFGEVYSDGVDIRARSPHHDGTNYYLYRVFKEGVDMKILQDKIYDGLATRKVIECYTDSVLPLVKRELGW